MLKKSININVGGANYTITHETTAWAGKNLVTINDKLVEGLPNGIKHVAFDIEL